MPAAVKHDLAEIAARDPYYYRGCYIELSVAERDALVAALRECDRMFEYCSIHVWPQFGIVDEPEGT